MGFSLLWLLLLQSSGSRPCGLSGRYTQGSLLCSIWGCPRPGIKSLSPALTGGFLTTGSPWLFLDSYSFFVFCCLRRHLSTCKRCSLESQVPTCLTPCLTGGYDCVTAILQTPFNKRYLCLECFRCLIFLCALWRRSSHDNHLTHGIADLLGR